MLAKVVSESQRDWDKHVAPVMAAYRSTVHRSTGYSPNFIVYGKENVAPVDLVLAVGDEPPEVGASPDSFVQELLDRQRRVYDLVRQHLGQAAERRKKDYDFRVKHRDFQVNQWVWYLYPRRYKGRSPKWARQYTGPFLVVREIPPCNLVIQRSQRSKPLVVHADKLKACLGETPKSWLSVSDTGSEQPAATDEAEPTDEAPEINLFHEDGGDVPVVPKHPRPDEEIAEDDDPFVDAGRNLGQNGSPADRKFFRDRNRLRRPARYDV